MMRTTLTLDKDVAAVIERLRRTRDQSFRDIVNEALREGLKHMTGPRRRSIPFRTEAADLGHCRIENVDNVAEVLAVVENESFK